MLIACPITIAVGVMPGKFAKVEKPERPRRGLARMRTRVKKPVNAYLEDNQADPLCP